MENGGEKIFPTDYLNKDLYEEKRGRKAFVFWIVGNSGSGKSTLCKAVEKMLYQENILIKCLDGDNLRNTINSDLDLSSKSRIENIRRGAEISKMFLENGTSVLSCFISPSNDSRNLAKQIIGKRFRLIYIKATHEEVKKRDVKGLYKNDSDAMNKSLSMFEAPTNADLIINTTNKTVEYSANILFNFILNQPI